MPKIKTHSGAAKRIIKVTKNKKYKFQHAGKRHLLEHKPAGKKRIARKSAYAHSANIPQLKQMLPYD